MSRNQKFDLMGLITCLVLALAFRLPGLTIFLTADEPRSWFGRSIIFLDSLWRADFANTGPGGTVPFIENVSLSPAPGVTTLWTGAIGIILEYWRQGMPGSLDQFLGELPFDPLNPEMLFTLRLPGVLIAVAAVGLTYWWSRPLLGRRGALLAAALLALDPFYLALSRVLGHDALVTTFMWLSLLAFLRAVGNRRISESANSDRRIPNHHPTRGEVEGPPHASFIILSGAFAGLAFLSKYPALFIGIFIALAMLIIYLLQMRTSQISNPKSPLSHRAAKGAQASRFTFHASPTGSAVIRWLTDMTLWAAAAGLVFVFFWPAMWVGPLGPVTAIVNDAWRASGAPHQKGSFFLGQPVPDPGLLFYPLVALLRTTPVVLFGVVLSLWQSLRRIMMMRQQGANGESANRRMADGKVFHHSSRFAVIHHSFSLLTLYLWAYIILYTLLITYGGKKQDRYLLPAFPALIMLATMGYTYVAGVTFHASRFRWLIPVAALLLQIIVVLPSYPYYFSFYNPLAGGAATAAKTVLVGWGEGLNEAAAYLNTLPDAGSARVTSWYSTTFEPYFRGQAIYKIDEEKISRSPKPGLAADYVVFYINQLQRHLPSDGLLAYFQQHEPIHTVSLNGQAYAWIYSAPAVSHIIGGEARLVGQAELLGFDWFDAQGRPLEALPSGSVATLRLYWEWQGKSASDPIQVSLVGGDGYTWGWGHLSNASPAEQKLARLDPAEGAIVVSDYALAVFPGTPPGQYYLQAWIERPATGEVVGQFPLAAGDAAVVVTRPLVPPRPDDFDIETRLGASFGSLRLLGYNFAGELWDPGRQRTLELFWTTPPEIDLPQQDQPAIARLALLPLPQSPVSNLQSPSPNLPTWQRMVTPAYPPSRWQPGDLYRDVWPLSLPHHVPKGEYDLQLTVNQVETIIGRIEVGGRERLFERPPIASPLEATLGDSIKLLGYEVNPQLLDFVRDRAQGRPPISNNQSPPSNTHSLSVTLFWQATDVPAEDYTVFVQLLDANNKIVAQRDSQPQEGAAPTITWAAGEIVVDQYTLSLQERTEGRYRLIVGMYRPDSGARLRIVSEEGETDALTLTVIEMADQ